MVDHIGNRTNRKTRFFCRAQVHHKDGHAFGLFTHLGQRRGSGQQNHEVRVLHPRNPNFLAIDHIAVTFFDGGGFDFGGVGSGGGLGYSHGLQTPFTRGDFGQIQVFLRLRAVPQQSAHVVHLPMARPRVASIAVDFFHDHRGFRQPQARATVFGGNQRRQPTRLGQGIYKRLGVGAVMVHLAVVFVRKLSAQILDGVANVLIGVLSIHRN